MPLAGVGCHFSAQICIHVVGIHNRMRSFKLVSVQACARQEQFQPWHPVVHWSGHHVPHSPCIGRTAPVVQARPHMQSVACSGCAGLRGLHGDVHVQPVWTACVLSQQGADVVSRSPAGGAAAAAAGGAASKSSVWLLRCCQVLQLVKASHAVRSADSIK
jgi:hypothetical protein